jgi:co-chaperonin GroES (HSP10)
MKAVNHYLVIERIKDEPTKVGGLILTEQTDEDNRYLKAKVISIGNLVEGIKHGTIFVFYGRNRWSF